ncbi:MAG: outer membrane protein assembly factor BamD [Candidatus Omnitrophica bacterium]|nr:outer membrane protein assembly factor BamD [Candidatus Omnitrophota bacterium]
MKLYVIILSLLLQGCFCVPCVKASEADLEWKEAVGLAKQGEYDFAFMNFRTILDDYPNSRYALTAKFAQGEYYFLQNNLQMASDEFKSFYATYPRHQEALIALAYLYKIAQIQKRPESIKEYHNKAASFRQLTFIFNDKKSFKFLSGFQRKHKLVSYINKVELYVNGELFTEVPF